MESLRANACFKISGIAPILPERLKGDLGRN